MNKHKSKQLSIEEEEEQHILLNAIPEDATIQVWITVFSCRVNGCFSRRNFSRAVVHDFTIANPNSPAATLSDGITPVVRFNLQTMKLNTMLKRKLVAIDLNVIWFLHDGTFESLNASSTIIVSSNSVSCCSLLLCRLSVAILLFSLWRLKWE